MPQSLSQIFVHLVFSTKERRPFLNDAALRADVHAYLGGVVKNQGNEIVIVGGVSDHAHLLLGLGRETSISELVREIKPASSLMIHREKPGHDDFQWQAGYGAFSVSPPHVPALKEYIRNQEEHHRKESFQDEYRRFLKKYGFEIDEKYLWD